MNIPTELGVQYSRVASSVAEVAAPLSQVFRYSMLGSALLLVLTVTVGVFGWRWIRTLFQ